MASQKLRQKLHTLEAGARPLLQSRHQPHQINKNAEDLVADLEFGDI